MARSSAAAEKGVESTALRTRTGARPMAADHLSHALRGDFDFRSLLR